MTARVLTASLCLLAFAAVPALAQEQTPSPAQPTRSNTQRPSPQQPATTPPLAIPPPAGAPQQAPRREGQPVNIKVEVTITDQRGGREALRKTVTVVTGDELAGFIRSQANYTGIGVVPLNVDVQPRLLADNKIRLVLNLQYNLPAASVGGGDATGAGTLRTTDIHENLALIVENGKPIMAAQSADPVGDRQVTVEVKATILR
jgi:hypothetical protein